MSHSFFFFNDTATTEIYTLSLHDALPISWAPARAGRWTRWPCAWAARPDRKSTRLNSSHLVISYAVFCLKKKKNPYDVAGYVSTSFSNPAHTYVPTSSAKA